MKNSREVREQATHEGSVSLPPCALEEDEGLVSDAALQIKRILTQTVNRGLEDVGEYLFDTFYDGDPNVYMSAHQHKHASLRLLLDRCGTLELPVNKAFLSRAIQMAMVLRQLPKQSRFLALPSSHRLELLKVKSPDKLEQLAEKAYQGNMSVQKLRDVVSKEFVRTKSTRGRKPIPSVIKTINVCVKALRDEDTGRLALKRDDIAKLSDDETDRARMLADLLSKRVEELLKLLA